MTMLRVFFVIFASILPIVFYSQYVESMLIFIFLDIEYDSIVYMYNGESSASGSSFPAGPGPNTGGGPNSGGGAPNPGGVPNPIVASDNDNDRALDSNRYNGTWRPFNYKDHPNKRGIEVIPYIHTDYILNSYNPEGDIPPKTDRELSVLLDYRFEHKVRSLGYKHWNVDKAFPDDTIVDKISKARLYNHIYDNKKYLGPTFNQMDFKSDNTPWDKVIITSQLINSLQKSIQ